MNDLMDGLIQDMSTGIYTTKRPYPVQRYVFAHNSNVSWNLPNISGVVSCLLHYIQPCFSTCLVSLWNGLRNNAIFSMWISNVFF